MAILSFEDYNRIYFVDSFWPEYKSLFGKNKSTYQLEKKYLLTKLNMLDKGDLSELLKGPSFERLSNEDLHVIRHVNKRNSRVIFAAMDDDGGYILLTSFFEKNTSDYAPAISKAKKIMKQFG